MNLKPLGDRIVVKVVEELERTKGGIVLPDTAKEKPQKGTVLAVGDGRLTKDGNRVPFQVAKGDKVIFSSYAGSEIKIEGQEYMLMDEADILAILD